MTTTLTAARHRFRPPVPVPEDHSVTSFELFFDLVFVYALTQVTTYMATHPDGRGVLEAMLLLGVMWWSWVGYSWLGTVTRADEGLERSAMLVAMGALLIQGIALPEAFHDAPGGLAAPLVFAGCSLVVRVLHLALFLRVAVTDAALRAQVLRFAVPTAAGVVPVVAGAVAATQGAGRLAIALFAISLVNDIGGNLVIGAEGWRVDAPGHFAERHGLIVIIALGESLVSIGAGVQEHPLTGPVVLGAVAGLVIVAVMWWSYFDVVSIVAESVLARLTGTARAALGRDSYSMLHLPMLAGILLVALGLKKALRYIAEAGTPGAHPTLHGLPAIALTAGLAAYLLGHIAFRLRNVGTLNRQRLVVVVALLALTPAVGALPVLGALWLVAGVLAALTTYEALRFAEARHSIRRHVTAGHVPGDR